MAEQVTLETRGSQDGRLTLLRLAPGGAPRHYRIPLVGATDPLLPERYSMRAGAEIRPFKLQPWTRPGAAPVRPFLHIVSRNDAPLAPWRERPRLRLVARNDDLPEHGRQPGVAPEHGHTGHLLVNLIDSPAG